METTPTKISWKEISLIILSGLAGTALMTMYVNNSSRKSSKHLKVVKVLGTMLTDETPPSKSAKNTPDVLAIGTMAHYLIGVGFALSYYVLWKFKVIKLDLKTSLVLGFVSGLIGIAIWRTFFLVHPHPTRTPLKTYFKALLGGHVVFGVVTIYTFKFLKGALKNYVGTVPAKLNAGNPRHVLVAVAYPDDNL